MVSEVSISLGHRIYTWYSKNLGPEVNGIEV